MTIELARSQVYEQVKDLMKRYYQLEEYSSNTSGASVRGGIETRVAELSLNGREIIDLIDDLKTIAQKDAEMERDWQVEQAVELFNDKKKYRL